MDEEWRILDDWPDFRISNLGRIYSIRRDRLVKASLDEHGYFRVNLSRDRVWKKIRVHRLVALLFVEGYFPGAHVKHKDGDTTNNAFSNLEWVDNGDLASHASRKSKERMPIDDEEEYRAWLRRSES